jgi:serine protease Do
MIRAMLTFSLAIWITGGYSQDLSALFEKVSPAVVQIQTTEHELIGTGSNKQMVTAEGIGSGVLISEDGKILTAAHVVQTAEEVKVTLKNDKVIPAKIVNVDKTADVALIELVWMPKDKDIFIPNIMDSDKVRVGEEVFIIGSPYGLNQSLSVGHISGRHKKTSVSHHLTLMEFFQTDASINTGNSGGPMFNMDGEVIGIVSYILSESGGFQGLGFAATSNIAKKLVMDEKGIWFGVDGELLSPGLARVLNLPQNGGILVQKVADLSPGSMMGLKEGMYKMKIEGQELLVGGDIVLSIMDQKIEDPEDMILVRQMIAQLKSEDEIVTSVMRGGKLVELKYVIP